MLIFFISAALLTIPLPHVYNSITVILFVAWSLLSYHKEHVKFRWALAPFAAFFGLMLLSLIWSVSFAASLKALGREASLIFIPLAFCFNAPLSKRGVYKVLENYSLGIFAFTLYLLGRAVYRYNVTGSKDVFFYHELSTKDINAIYLSVMVAVAVFYFLTKRRKTYWGYATLFYLIAFVFLLSSKVIIITTILLVLVYYLFYSGMERKARALALGCFIVLAGLSFYYGKIGDRIASEFDYQRIDVENGGVHRVTLGEAWNRDSFNDNDYFNGTALRLYQIRIFKEMLQEDPIFLRGYGLSASAPKIEQKGIDHNIVHGGEEGLVYNKVNFHNQYVEVFADLGVFGLILVLVLLVVNLKNAFTNKEFVHIAFAFLMISLFLTESFLWRQRGAVFFTMLYCLFNTGLIKEGSEK